VGKSSFYFSAGQDARLWLHHCKHANKTLCPCVAVINKLVQLTMKIGNPGVIGFYMTFMQTLHQTLGWCYPVWAVTHAGHCVPPDTMDVIDGTYRNCWTIKLNGRMKHKLVFLSEHIPRDTCLVLMGHSVGCYIILEMLTLDPELQVVKSVMPIPTIEPYLPVFLLSLLPEVFSSIQQASRHSVTVWLNVRIGKTSDVSNFECGMIIGARHVRSSISETALWMFCHSYVQLVFYYGACDHWYHVQYHQETKRDFPNGDIRLCSRGIRHALVLDTGKEVADMIVEWIHGNLQTWS
uniref:Lipid droplet-associated hydrolase n=1 Tax=Oncorhynchus kisutch TaxID=8019 RepID=A0A8C7F4C2_ONCKI